MEAELKKESKNAPFLRNATSFLLASIFSSPQINIEPLASKMSPTLSLKVQAYFPSQRFSMAQKVLGMYKGILSLIQ